MRLVLLHYHILKNGGSTIEEILRRSFWETFASFDLAGQEDEIKTPALLAFLERNPHVKALSSHQIFYPVPRAPGFLFFDICFLRDPMDRFRSIYDYFRGRPTGGDPIRELANQHPPGEFIRRLIEEMPWAVHDVQVNLLAHGIVNDPPQGGEDLEVATARMLETSFLGVVDRFNESLVAAQRLNALFPGLNCVQAPVNDSAKPGSTLAERREEFRASCDPGVYEELLRLNAMDFELLARARAEIRRRFELIPDHQERLRGLKEGVSILVAAGDSKPVPQLVSELSAAVRRKARPKPLIPEPGPLTRLARRLRFATRLRAMRSGSELRLLFDADYYRETYPDVAASGADPLWHFVTIGAFEGRDPHPLFDTSFYLAQCGRAPTTNALLDYLERGDAAGLKPHPLFDPAFYAQRYPDVRETRMNPLTHYVLHGVKEGRKPCALFQPEYYLTVCEDARNGGNPLAHFAGCEGSECFSPHPLFDCASYLSAHPKASGNLLVDYLTRPPDLHGPRETGVGVDTARIAIQDVEILVAFPGVNVDPHRVYAALRTLEFPGESAVMWRDASGATHFLCAPQQRPFFECVRYDQLAAQINGTL